MVIKRGLHLLPRYRSSFFMMFYRYDIMDHSVVVVSPMKMEISHRAGRYVWKYTDPVNISLPIILYLERNDEGEESPAHRWLLSSSFRISFDWPRNASFVRKPRRRNFEASSYESTSPQPRQNHPRPSRTCTNKKIAASTGLKYVLPVEFDFSLKAGASFSDYVKCHEKSTENTVIRSNFQCLFDRSWKIHDDW